MALRPSFIASRINGVETLHFAETGHRYTLAPTGQGDYVAGRYPKPLFIGLAPRAECFRRIIETEGFAL